MDLQSIFARLGGIKPIGTTDFCPIPEAEIMIIESEFKVRLPEPYRSFIGQYGASTFRGSSADNPYIEFRTLEPLPPQFQSDKAMFAGFYGAGFGDQEGYSLRVRIHYYSGRIPDSMIPIGDSWGSQICLGIKGNKFGKVYFWDEQNEPLDEASYLKDFGEPKPPEAMFQNVHLIANSFEGFLWQLEVADPE